MPDPEIEAMSSVADALSVLDDDAVRSRVLRWAAEKYGVALAQPFGNGVTTNQASFADASIQDHNEAPEDTGGKSSKSSSNGTANSISNFGHFTDLFDAVQPRSNLERAVTAAYWVQQIQGKANWQSQEINKHLQDLGHRDTHINHTLTSGMQTKPAQVLQIKKSGASRQARKTYKLSAEGIKIIQSRLAQNS